jgi:glutaredoxin
MQLVLYSKPGCHLCEGLEEKLRQVQGVELEIRDITTRDDWFQSYEYEVPVVLMQPSSVPLPRFSPRSSVPQITQLLIKYRSERAEKS